MTPAELRQHLHAGHRLACTGGSAYAQVLAEVVDVRDDDGGGRLVELRLPSGRLMLCPGVPVGVELAAGEGVVLRRGADGVSMRRARPRPEAAPSAPA